MSFNENGRMRESRIMRESQESYIHDKLVPILKEKMLDVWEENINRNLELYGAEKVDYCNGESYDGFMSTCEASLDVWGWTTTQYLEGSGYGIGDEKCKELLSKLCATEYEYAAEAVYDEYADQLKAKEIDKGDIDFAHDDIPHIIALATGEDEAEIQSAIYDKESDGDQNQVDALVRVIFHKSENAEWTHWDDRYKEGSYEVMILSSVSFDEYNQISKNWGSLPFETEFTFSESEDPEEVCKKILAEVEKAVKSI